MDPASKVVVSPSIVLSTRNLLFGLQWLCLSLQVIKIGTSSLLRHDLSSINLTSLARICETVKELRKMGKPASLLWLYRVTRRMSPSVPQATKLCWCQAEQSVSVVRKWVSKHAQPPWHSDKQWLLSARYTSCGTTKSSFKL